MFVQKCEHFITSNCCILLLILKNVTNHMNFREASHIDFVHEKRHMDVGGGGLAPVTFLGEKSWKISIV